MSDDQAQDKNVNVINSYEKQEKDKFSCTYFIQTIPILPFNLAIILSASLSSSSILPLRDIKKPLYYIFAILI